MDTITYAKGSLEQALNLLGVAADGMDAGQYNLKPDGTCNAAAKNHVHAWTALDFFVLNAAAGGEMRWPAVAQANGLPANAQEIWNYDGEIPTEAIKAYGQDVKKASLEYIAGLKAEDLERQITTPFGTQNLAWVIQLMTVHAAGHAGDIAAVKGMQGLKGLPF